jgi:hypothetical protein
MFKREQQVTPAHFNLPLAIDPESGQPNFWCIYVLPSGRYLVAYRTRNRKEKIGTVRRVFNSYDEALTWCCCGD